MFSGSVNAGFILALPFHHGKLEPDYVGVLTGELMCGIKIPLLDFALKMQGGGYLRDTTANVTGQLPLPCSLATCLGLIQLHAFLCM